MTNAYRRLIELSAALRAATIERELAIQQCRTLRPAVPRIQCAVAGSYTIGMLVEARVRRTRISGDASFEQFLVWLSETSASVREEVKAMMIGDVQRLALAYVNRANASQAVDVLTAEIARVQRQLSQSQQWEATVVRASS